MLLDTPALKSEPLTAFLNKQPESKQKLEMYCSLPAL